MLRQQSAIRKIAVEVELLIHQQEFRVVMTFAPYIRIWRAFMAENQQEFRVVMTFAPYIRIWRAFMAENQPQSSIALLRACPFERAAD